MMQVSRLAPPPPTALGFSGTGSAPSAPASDDVCPSLWGKRLFFGPTLPLCFCPQSKLGGGVEE